MKRAIDFYFLCTISISKCSTGEINDRSRIYVTFLFLYSVQMKKKIDFKFMAISISIYSADEKKKIDFKFMAISIL